MKIKLYQVAILTVIFTVLFFLIMWAMASSVLAQGEPPDPYAGLKNPFPWDDASAQQAGKQVYQTYCSGCHGANGRALAAADFGAADFPQKLEQRPDLYFWILSEGRLNKGMPPFKLSLSEQARWQSLTYLWSLAKAATPQATPAPNQPAVKTPGSLVLVAPAQSVAGQPLTMAASLQDEQGKPVSNATVEFFVKEDFFTSGLMKIGEVPTNSQGIATLKYSPRETGEIQVVARYQAIEADATVGLTGNNEAFYQPEAGIKLPNVGKGKDVYIGPQPDHDPGQPADRPIGTFRLPGGISSWLLLVVATVMLIWVAYFRVFFQVLRIPVLRDTTGTDTRLVPRAALGIIVALGLLLVLAILHGPYSHLHLLR